MVDCEEMLPLHVEPDIEGIGIIVGFLTTAYLSVLLLLGQYLFGFDPYLNPSRNLQPPKPANPETSKDVFSPNPFDVIVYRCSMWLRKKLCAIWQGKPKGDAQHKQTLVHPSGSEGNDGFSRVILSISDQQTISGIAIMASGYSEIANDLTVYHWVVIGRLAWFTAVTHLAVLSCLRTYMYRRPFLRSARLFLMFSQIVLLLVATIPLGAAGDIEWEHRAACLFTEQGEYELSDPISLGVFMVLSFFLRLYKIYQPSLPNVPRCVKNFFLSIPQGILKAMAKLQNGSKRWNVFWHMVILQPFAAHVLILRIYLHLFSSMLFEIWTVCAAAVWGMQAFVAVRKSRADRTAPQYEWSYGQIVPMVMLLGPLLVLWDHFTDHSPKLSDATKVSVDSQEPKSEVARNPEVPDSRPSVVAETDNSYHDPQVRQMSEAGDPSTVETLGSCTSTYVTSQSSQCLNRLRLADKDSFIAISVAMLFESLDNKPSNKRPRFGRFNDLGWFPYIFIQLCSSAIFTNWWSFSEGRMREDGKSGDLVVIMLLYCFNSIPLFWGSVWFILYWPRNTYCISVWGGFDLNHGGIFYGMATSALAIAWAVALETMHWGYPSFYLSLFAPSIKGVVIGCMPGVLHFFFSIFWAIYRTPPSEKPLPRNHTVRLESQEQP